MAKNRPLILHLKKADFTVTFEKLSNRQWYEFYSHFSPIFEDWDFQMLLDLHHYKEKDFNLAKMYMALYSYFGGHNNYDDYKCSFSYRFKLTIEQKNKKFEYGLALMDMKGNMPYFTYYRQPLEGENPDAYQSPIDDQFSKEDMRLCTMTFISYLEGFFLGYKPYFNQPFYRINHAGYLIYGFEKGEFFNIFYPYSEEEDYENFKKEIEKYKKKKSLQTDMSKDFWKDAETVEA